MRAAGQVTALNRAWFAAAEFDTQPGPVKEHVMAFLDEWLGTLEAVAARARDNGAIDASEDPAQLVFELDSYLLMANMAFLLNDDRLPLERARAAFRARLARARTDGLRPAAG